MKVIRTIESFYPRMSGPANQAFKIAQELEKKGIKSPIITTDFGVHDVPNHEKMEQVDISRFHCKKAMLKYCYAPSAKRAFVNFDIIHSHNYRNYLADLGFRFASKHKKPFVINTHGSLLGYNYIVRGGFSKLPYYVYDSITNRRTVLKADKVIVSSTMEKDEAESFGVKGDKIEVIPMGADISEYPLKKKETDTLNLLFVGRISRDRNLELLIRIAKSLKEKKTKFSLKIVGGEVKRSETQRSGYIDELKRKIEKLGLNQEIEFTGPLFGQKLKEQYSSSNVFIYTSGYENFGQTILEAAAAGLSILTTPVGVSKDLIIDGENGYLINDDPSKMSEIIISLKDKALREKIRREIQEKVKIDFNWKNIIDDYISVYNSFSRK